MSLSTQGFPFTFPFGLKLADLLIKVVNKPLGTGHRCYEHTSLALPTIQSFHFLASTPKLGLDFLTESALCSLEFRQVHEPHATRFTSAVFIIALMSKTGPVPVTACESLLIIEAHFLELRQQFSRFGFCTGIPTGY
jgi:hypothetical protein